MVKRQFPKPSEVFDLLKFKKPELNPKRRRLDAALTTWDLRTIAKRRTPKAAFDYTDGAAEGEISLGRARKAFEDVEFHPDILRPAEDVDTSCQILGGPSALPFGIAPTARSPEPGRPMPPASPSRSPPWAPRPSRTSKPSTPPGATGSSSTSCGVVKSPTGWSNGPPPQVSTL